MRTIVEACLDDLDRIREVTLDTARLFPGGNLNPKPVPGMRSAGQILAHILDTEIAVAMAIGTGVWRFGQGPHRLSRLETFERWSAATRRRTLEYLANLDDDRLWQPAEAPDGAPLSVFLLFQTIAENEIHHRGQLFVYLRLLGLEPPWLYGGPNPQK